MSKTRAARHENPLETNPPPRIPRSSFDRSYSHKTTFDSGYLIPLHVDEVLPGDTVTIKPVFFGRMATPYQPFMDGLKFEWQAFFIPARQVWPNFVKQQGERVDPDDHNDYTTPQMTAPAGGHLVGSLADYFSMPTEEVYDHTALFHRCYVHTWNTWYRDADLQDTVPFPTDDGPDDPADYTLLRRGKRKDYLSGARPFAQRGTAVELPLGTSAPVTLTDGTVVGDGGTIATLQGANAGILSVASNAVTSSSAGSGTLAFGASPGLELGDLTGVADLSSATAATINTIRQALATQHVFERDARGGGRYWESVNAHFGVTPDHIQLQRPLLLGTGSQDIQTQTVPQTVPDGGTFTNKGELGAYSMFGGVGRGFVHSSTEHGFIMVLGSVRAILSYQQGLNRMFSRLTRFDHYLPDLATLGEQAVLSKEIYVDGTANDDTVWGYQPRYEEYRHRDSVITGQMRSTYAQSLDIWHVGLHFLSRPVLNDAFIEENPPISRLIIDTAAPEFLLDAFFKIRHVRPMPRFGQPGLTRF